MKTVYKSLAVVSLLAAATVAYAQMVTCPIDKMRMYFTGNMSTEMGRMLHEYKCPNGHTMQIVK